MSLMPYLTPQETQVDMVNVFGGYNHKASIQDGEFFDMKNLTCDDYPLAASRAKRGLHNLGVDGEVLGVVGQDKLNVVYKKGQLVGTIRGDYPEAPAYDYVKQGTTTYLKCVVNNPVTQLLRNTNNMYAKGTSGFINLTCLAYDSETGKMGFRLNNINADYQRIFNQWFSSMSNVRAYQTTYSGRTCWYSIINSMSSYVKELFDEIGSFEFYTYYTELHGPYKIIGAEGPDSSYLYTFYITDDDADIPYNQSIESRISWYTECGNLSESDSNALSTLSPDDVATEKLHIDLETPYPAGEIDITFYINGQPLHFSKLEYSGGENYIYADRPVFPIADGSKLTDREKLYIVNYDVATGEKSENTQLVDAMDGEHNIVKMGAYVIIFPEKVKVNTSKISGGVFTEIENLEKYEEVDTNDVSWSSVYSDGDALTFDYVSDTAPTNPSQGDVWIDTSEKPAVTRKYSETLGNWAVIATYIEFRSTTQLSKWKEYDALEIDWGTLVSLLDLVEDQKYYVVSDAGEKNGQHYVRIPVAFKSNSTSYLTYKANSFKMELPILDYVFECGNRLWGCRYGTDVKGDFVNEIFASRLGDPGNFHYFANTSMDAFYVSLGDEGPFTGGVAYNSQPVFFRQNKVHRITGQYPANYQLKTSVGYGVQIGSHKSIVNVNNIVYYLSAVGMMAYSGDIPVSIADPFGKDMYHNGIAGTIGNKYYISMLQEDETPVFFCYDDAKGMWHKEDDLRPLQLVTYNNECYAVTSEGLLIATGGVTGDEEPDFDWMMQTGEIGYGSPFKKQLIKMTIRLKMGIKSYANIDIQYDNDGNWIRCSELRPTGRVGSIAVPISPCRCDYFTIRIKGHGDIKLVSVAKFYEEGSDEA